MLHIHLTADEYPTGNRLGITVQEIATDGSKEGLWMTAVIIPQVQGGLFEIHWTEWTQDILREAMLAVSRKASTEQ